MKGNSKIIPPLLVFCIALPCLVSCGGSLKGGDAGDSVDRDVSTDTAADDGEVLPPPPSKIDILFVVDSSGSMALEQPLLAQNLPEIVRLLLDPPKDEGGDRLYQPVRDLHVGVVNGYMGVASQSIQTCETNPAVGDDGVLLHVPHGTGCDATYPTFLAYDIGSTDEPDPVTTADFAADFGCVGLLGSTGCGFQQHLEAAHKALTVHARPGGPNDGFLRGDSLLAIIFVTDDDDCSVKDPTFFDITQLEYGVNLHCFKAQDKLHGTTRYAEEFAGLRSDPYYLVVGMIVAVPPLVSACNGKGSDLAGCLDAPQMEKKPTSDDERLEPSCVYPPGCQPPDPPNPGDCAGEGTPPERFVKLAQALGTSAFVTSICSESFNAVLNPITEKLR